MAKKQSPLAEAAMAKHRTLGGKISVVSKVPLKTLRDLSLYYTPGVAEVSTYLAKHKEKLREYTIKKNSVAVVSDGSAVLGLGNIGPEGALPVMEGKAMIFKEFAGIDAFPIVLATQDVEEIIETVVRIAPVFGGINLEDISAPRCFAIEGELKRRLTIPVMHDDQHGTAIVVLAALINAFKVVKKDIRRATIVIAGAGAAGTATAKLIKQFGVGDIIMLDRGGILSKHRHGLSPEKKELVGFTNHEHRMGGIAEALFGADAVIGVSGPNTIHERDVRKMARLAIVFALANPVPEVMPEAAKKAGAAVVASGRSDFPNQVNNALVFPGVFRGALDHGVRQITEEMKLKAAKALAGLIKRPTAGNIIPSVFDKRVVRAVAGAIR